MYKSKTSKKAVKKVYSDSDSDSEEWESDWDSSESDSEEEIPPKYKKGKQVKAAVKVDPAEDPNEIVLGPEFNSKDKNIKDFTELNNDKHVLLYELSRYGRSNEPLSDNAIKYCKLAKYYADNNIKLTTKQLNNIVSQVFKKSKTHYGIATRMGDGYIHENHIKYPLVLIDLLKQKTFNKADVKVIISVLDSIFSTYNNVFKDKMTEIVNMPKFKSKLTTDNLKNLIYNRVEIDLEGDLLNELPTVINNMKSKDTGVSKCKKCKKDKTVTYDYESYYNYYVPKLIKYIENIDEGCITPELLKSIAELNNPEPYIETFIARVVTDKIEMDEFFLDLRKKYGNEVFDRMLPFMCKSDFLRSLLDITTENATFRELDINTVNASMMYIGSQKSSNPKKYDYDSETDYSSEYDSEEDIEYLKRKSCAISAKVEYKGSLKSLDEQTYEMFTKYYVTNVLPGQDKSDAKETVFAYLEGLQSVDSIMENFTKEVIDQLDINQEDYENMYKKDTEYFINMYKDRFAMNETCMYYACTNGNNNLVLELINGKVYPTERCLISALVSCSQKTFEAMLAAGGQLTKHIVKQMIKVNYSMFKEFDIRDYGLEYDDEVLTMLIAYTNDFKTMKKFYPNNSKIAEYEKFVNSSDELDLDIVDQNYFYLACKGSTDINETLALYAYKKGLYDVAKILSDDYDKYEAEINFIFDDTSLHLLIQNEQDRGFISAYVDLYTKCRGLVN